MLDLPDDRTNELAAFLGCAALVLACASGCTNFRQHGGGDAGSDTRDGGGDLRLGTGGLSGGSGSSAPGTGGRGGTGTSTGGASGTGGSPFASGGATTAGGAPGTGGLSAGGTGGTGALGTGGAPVVCGPTQQKCGETCVLKTSPDFCGPTCMKCSAPAGGTATCDGTSCDFTCGTMKKCAASALCVQATGCCTNADCPALAGGQAGTCDSATHQCNYSCPANTQSCTSGTTVTCIAPGGCCKDADCAGACRICSAHACVAAVNIDDPTGRCAGTCNATGVCKSKRGQLCSTVTAGCVEGTSCAPDGYCCNTACTGSCQACDIQGSVGTCTSVNAGPPHSNHSACGTDPACLGTCSAGACAYATKACGSPASCTGNSSIAASMCSAGACITPPPLTCSGGFSCAGATCGTSCSGSTGCASTAYCSGTACATKKPAGQLCAASAECASALCGGRCCNPGAACSCPQPSAGNLVRNPGFDQNATGWTVSNAPGSSGVWVSTEDANGCPFSGAFKITAQPNTFGETAFNQCVHLTTPGPYNVGMRWKVLPGGSNAGIICNVYLTNDATCATYIPETGSMIFLSDPYPVGWSSPPDNQNISGVIDNFNGLTYMFLTCSGRDGIAVDTAYVTSQPGAY